MSSAIRSIANYNAHQRPTVGDTKTSVVSVDHIGWLKCDGRQLSTSEFSALFSVLGYSFGGSGSSFALPDPQGRVAGYVGQSVGNDWQLGDASGAETHTLTIAEMPSHNHGTDASDTVVGNNLTDASGGHTHTINDPGHTHSYFNQPNTVNPATSLTTTDVADNVNVNQTTGSSTTGITINPVTNHQHHIATQGGGDEHNNMQPTLFLGNLFIYCGKPRVGTNPSYNAFPPTYSATRTGRIY